MNELTTEPTEEELEQERIEAERLAEIERLAELERIKGLTKRWDNLSDTNAVCHRSDISNPLLYFNKLIIGNPDKEDAEAKLSALEAEDIVYQEERALDLAEIEEDRAERKSIKKLWKQIQDPAAKKILKRIIKDYYGD